MREDYVVSKAARGLEEIFKGRVKAARVARDTVRATRRAETASRRAAAADPVPDNLVLNPNPPKPPVRRRVAVENPTTSVRTRPQTMRERAMGAGATGAAYVSAHPYRTAALTGGVLVPAGGGAAAYGLSRRKKAA